jgi:ABC-type antimicrobial peptide transport system ATPase subunit
MVYEFAELRGLVGCQAGGRLSTRSPLQIDASREESVLPLQLVTGRLELCDLHLCFLPGRRTHNLIGAQISAILTNPKIIG